LSVFSKGVKYYCDKLVLTIDATEIEKSLEEDVKLAEIKIN
jgi:protoporphyrinogen oxidase